MKKESKIESEKIEKLVSFADKLNTVESVNKLEIPILDDFTIVEDNKIDKNIIFVATDGKGSLEQLISDGSLVDDETLEDHIEKVISDIAKEIDKKPLYKGEKFLNYCGKYTNKDFTFEIYAQDVILTRDKFIRQLIAFFVEKEDNIFYELTIAQGPFSKEKYPLIKDINKFSEDRVNAALEKQLKIILDNLKYKDKRD